MKNPKSVSLLVAVTAALALIAFHYVGEAPLTEQAAAAIPASAQASSTLQRAGSPSVPFHEHITRSRHRKSPSTSRRSDRDAPAHAE